MFEIEMDESGTIVLSGRFDASQTEKAREFFQNIYESKIVDFKKLDYISSAGLGVLLGTQKRLNESKTHLN